ncbi:MAG: hypothetical protein JJ863_32225 [Deltaproteobacteria bacterium]|nr:hypothetical protein [Deltaproteobacteria bacterium]
MSALLLVSSLGCGDDDGGGDGPLPDGSIDPSDVTYHADIVPLIQRECLTCHVEGGIGPFRLDSYDAVVDQSASVISAVNSGYMPPWQPNRDCGEFVGERGLSAEERATFVAWNAGGLQEGDPADAPPPPEDELVDFTPTHVAAIGDGGYTADVTRPDDYRCFVLDAPVDETRYLTGSWVEPGQKEIVHHVLVYAVPPEDAGAVDAANGADGTIGYTCFGGPTPDSETGVPPTQLGAWVPGQLPNILPEGRGVRIEAGSRIVMQVHYNTLEVSPGPDETEFQMVLTTDEPEILIETKPMPILDLEIEAGESDVTHTRVFRNWQDTPVTITTLSAHMHLLGTQFSARWQPAIGGTGEEMCLLEIPEWDFQWQQGYRRPQDSPVVLQPGEGIEVSCTYDNSAVNQPVVNGVQVPPSDVTWGEGTLDEMCILYISREVPFAERVAPVDTCAALDDCRTECGDSLDCVYACDALNTRDRECQNCATTQLVSCVTDTTTCGLQWLGVGDCLRNCIVNVNILDGNLASCLSTECGSQYDAMITCTDEMLAAGTCDEYVSECSVGLGSGS